MAIRCIPSTPPGCLPRAAFPGRWKRCVMLEVTTPNFAGVEKRAKDLFGLSQEFIRAVQVSRAGEFLCSPYDEVRQAALHLLGLQLRHAKELQHEWSQIYADLAVMKCLGTAKWPQRNRGRRSQTGFRDLTIGFAVAGVAREGRLPATRSHTSSPASSSASSIVQAALAQVGLNLSERTIEDIWRKRHKPPLRP